MLVARTQKQIHSYTAGTGYLFSSREEFPLQHSLPKAHPAAMLQIQFRVSAP